MLLTLLYRLFRRATGKDYRLTGGVALAASARPAAVRLDRAHATVAIAAVASATHGVATRLQAARTPTTRLRSGVQHV